MSDKNTPKSGDKLDGGEIYSDISECISWSLERNIVPPIPDWPVKVRNRWWMWINFFQINGLFNRTIATSKEDIPDDLCIYESDFTEEGWEFACNGYQKWLARCTYDGPPKSGDKILWRELEKLRSREAEKPAEPDIEITPFEIPKRPASTIKPRNSWLKYDDADWHVEGKYPDDLGPDNAHTHIGMFLAFMLLSGYGAGEFAKGGESTAELEQLRTGKITPGRLSQIIDGSFFSEQLTDEGNAFAEDYYYHDSPNQKFHKDYYETLSAGLPSIYHIEDSWRNYMKMKPLFERRLAEWLAQRNEQ